MLFSIHVYLNSIWVAARTEIATIINNKSISTAMAVIMNVNKSLKSCQKRRSWGWKGKELQEDVIKICRIKRNIFHLWSSWRRMDWNLNKPQSKRTQFNSLGWITSEPFSPKKNSKSNLMKTWDSCWETGKRYSFTMIGWKISLTSNGLGNLPYQMKAPRVNSPHSHSTHLKALG